MQFLRKSLIIQRKTALNAENSHSLKGKESIKVEKTIFIFGLGYVGTALAYFLKAAGWNVAGTISNRSKDCNYKATELRKKGIATYFFDPSSKISDHRIHDALQNSSYLLSTVPPIYSKSRDIDVDIIVEQFKQSIIEAREAGSLKWIGYLSSTGVYGSIVTLPWVATNSTNAKKSNVLFLLSSAY